MTMKPPERQEETSSAQFLALEKEDKELNGGYLPELFEDWTCGETQRRGHASFES